MFSGDCLMKIGWGAVTVFVIMFLIFYRNDINTEVRVAVSGLFALAWCASGLIYGGGMKVKKQLQERIKELESSKS